MPVGTPIFSTVDGRVTTATSDAGIYPASGGRCGTTIVIAGIDGATYTYCHLSTTTATVGDDVVAGQTIGLSDGQPGTPGAGNTTGPHLHLGIRAYGEAICPQLLLLAIVRSTAIPPTAAPTIGCHHPGPTTD